MSVATTTSKIQYTLTTGSQALSIPFYFLDNAHIKAVTVATETVASITLVLGTDYTLTGAANPAGGTLTTIATVGNSLAAGSKVVIKRNVPITQPTSYSPNDAFPAKVHEGALDRGIMIAQQSDEQSDRAIRFPEDDSRDSVLPSAVDRALKALVFDADGDVSVSATVDADGVVTPGSVGEASIEGAFRERSEVSVAAMKARSYAGAVNNQRVELLGYNTAGDGGGGPIRIDTTDTTTAGDDIFVFVASDGTRLKRPSGPISLNQGGVKGDGTDCTTALQAFFNNVASNSKITGVGSFLLTAPVNVTSKNLECDFSGCRFTLTGDNAGIWFHGTITKATVDSFTAVGDSVNRDANSTLAQVGLCFGNNAGDDISGVVVRDPKIEGVNVGIKIAYGTGPNNPVERARVINPDISSCIGYVGGCGYGVQFAQAPGSEVIGGSIRDCQRHGLYFSEGKDYRAVGVEVSGCGKNDGTIRGAISVARSGNVSLIGMLVHDNNDVGLACDTDAQGVSPNTNTEVNITGGVWKDNKYGDFIVGTSSNPAVDGVPHNVHITGATLKAPTVPGASLVTINQCDKLSLSECVLDASAPTSGSVRLITLNATGGAAYTDKISIKRNTLIGGGGATTYGMQVASTLCTGTQKIDIRDNDFTSISSEFEFLSGEDSVTNNTLLYNRRNGGGGVRTYTSSGTNISLPIGGLETLVMSSSGATSLAQFTGAVEGQVLAIFFTNGNTTVTAANFYLAGAVSFVATASDVLTLQYVNSAWREKSRSVN